MTTSGDDEMHGEDGTDGLVDDVDCGGGDLHTAIFDEDTHQVSSCDILVENSGPTDDGD